MRIAFNPSTVAALTTPPNNKDITFDLRGRNIFARGVEFKGTDTWRPVVDNLTSDSTTSSLSAKQGKTLKALIDGKSNSGHTHAWNSLTHSSTTANQAILTNGSANGWKLYTLNISAWDNAANKAHSHSNKTLLDGITSALVSSWNTAYNFVNNITKADTDKVINKWDEIVNFLAGIDSSNKLNTLLNSKLSVYELADKTNVGAIKNSGIYYSTTDASSSTLTNSPFNNGFTLINMTSYNGGDDLRRSRLAFNAHGEIKVSDDRSQLNTAETWYNVLTSKNSGINGSTIKLNGTSITVYSSGTADNRYVKKSGDTMTGILTVDYANFGALIIKRSDDSNGASIQFRGKSNIYGHIGFNATSRNKQLLRWNDAGSQVYTILDTSSTYISSGKGVINGTTITQVDNSDKLDGYHANTSQAPFGLIPTVGTDGVMEIGKYIDFHNDNGGKYDYSTRLQTTGNYQNTISLPSGTGTLALTSQIPTSLKNPMTLTTFGVVYDGSAAKVVSPSNFIGQIEEGTSAVTDGTMFITSYASNNGFADTNAVNIPYKRKAARLWDYIKTKTDSLYTVIGHNHDGRYVRAFGTTNDNIDSDWGQSFKTFDPIPSGTPPEKNPNISLLSIGENFNRRKQLAFIYSSDNIYYRRHTENGFSNWRRLAFANEIPGSLKNPHALTISLNGTSQGPYDGSAAKSINITPGSIGAATSGHTHDDRYLRLIGGTMTGTINRRSGGSTISGRNNAIIRQTYTPGGSSWNPIACVDTETGTWTLGHLSQGSSNTDFSFCFSTNTDYNAGNNNGNYVFLRNKAGIIALTSEIPNKNSWNYDDRYYTKAESNAKYITDITTSVNKLTFTRNGSNIDRTITVNNVQSLGRRSPLTERNAISGIYTYGTYSNKNNLAPVNYFETLGFGEGTAGAIEIGGSWISGGQLYWRALRDYQENWFAWKTILDSSNYSGILDSRYYTELEVNSLLAKKLDRVNLTTGSWNPRGYSLAADYHYNGGDISLSVNSGQMHVSVDGKFWQNEGQYRVLDTSDIVGLKNDITLHQYLSNTDTTWWPLVWGGNSHNNTGDSTGAVYKSHDKLSWQTSSQTLYATRLQTTSINLENNRGIFQITSGGTSPYKGIKLPNLQSNGVGIFSRVGNNSDEGGIIISEDTSVIYNSFDTGWGLSIRDKDLNQTDISNDNTIAFGVRQDYRAYSRGGFEKSGSSNSYVLLGGGGHKLESALNVANADTVDGYHYNDFTYKKYIDYNRNGPYNTKVFSKDISSLAWNASYLIFDIFSSGYNSNRVYFGRYEVSLGHWNNTDKNPTVYSRWIFKTSSAYDCVHVVKDLSNYKVDVYIENNLWDCSMRLSIVSIDGFNMLPANSWVNLPSASNNIQIINTTYLTFVGNSSSATKLQTARKLWGQSFDGTADVSGTLSGVANIQFSANNAYDIGSDSAASRYIYTHWLGARTGQKLELGANNSGFGQGLCIDTNLNVGIGTNSPSQKLEVVGNIKATGQIIRGGSSQAWVNGRDGALLRETSVSGYHALWSLKTTNGSWDFGEYNAGSGWNNVPVLSYVTDSNYNTGNNTTTYQIRFPLDSGTVALTKNIPSSLPANGGNADNARALRYTGTGNSEITAYQTDASYMGRSGWASYIICNHGSGSTYYSQTIAFPFWSSPIYRRLEGGTDRGWKKFYTEENPPSWDNVTNKPSSFTPSSHTHSWASITDKIVAGNEFNIVNAGFKEGMWFNYLPINDRSKTATISSYHFGNGAKGYASIVASGFIKSGGNASQLLRADGGVAAFNWSGQAGQPTWLWGGNSQHSYYVYNPSNFRVAYAASADNSDKVDGYHATDGRTFNGNINWSSNWNDTWSDGTNKHPWYGFDHRYPNTGAYSTTISDYFGMTIKTANTLRLDCEDLLINGTNISNLNVASATNAYHLRINFANSWSTWYWSGQSGQPTWLWGSNDGTNMYVWNPSNFSVNYANSAGSATKVIVNQHTANDANYPLVWSNQFNTNSATENQLFKSWADLYYNPKNKRLCVAGRAIIGASAVPSYTLDVRGSIIASSWLRTRGAAGWYSESYGGGIWMSDTSWIRTYGGKNFYCDHQIYSSNSIRMGDIYLQNTNEINNGANGLLHLNYRNTGNVTICNGGGKVGIGKSDPLYTLDVAGNGRFQDFVYCNVVYSTALNHTSSTGHLVIGNKTKEISIRSSNLPDLNALYLYQKFSTNVYYSANKGFGIRPYYLSNAISSMLPTETVYNNKYSVLTVGDKVQAISCIIADKTPLMSGVKGTLIRFMPGDDGQIVLLKDLNNYGTGSNGYFWVQPKGCSIIRSDNSGVYIADGNISSSYDDGNSRFFIYAKTHKVWIEFLCG